jgi:hypothetical protein
MNHMGVDIEKEERIGYNSNIEKEVAYALLLWF